MKKIARIDKAIALNSDFLIACWISTVRMK
jgi:hypothetical protein